MSQQQNFGGGGSSPSIPQFGGSVTTTDDTPTTIATFAMTAGSTVSFRGLVSAIESSLADGVGGSFVASANRAVSTVLVGVPNIDVDTTSGLTTATFDVQISGNNVIFVVIGEIGKTIQWTCVIEYLEQTFI